MQESRSIRSAVLVVLMLFASFQIHEIPEVAAPPFPVHCTSGFVSPVMSDITIDGALLNASAVVTSMASSNYSYEVHSIYRFDLRNPGDHEATTMFAHAMAGDVNVHSFSLDYWIDDEEENYTTILYQSTELLGRYDTWARYSSVYHILNVTLVNTTSVALNVAVSFQISASADILNLGLAASDSLPWNHSAFQTIVLSVFNRTVFRNISFEPPASISTLGRLDLTTARWELNMTSFSEKYVLTELVQNIYEPPGYDPFPATALVVLIVVAGLVVVRRYTRSEG